MTSGRTVPRFEVIGITGIGEIVAGDGLPDIIVSAARAQGTAIEDGDILVVTQKVVSKAGGQDRPTLAKSSLRRWPWSSRRRRTETRDSSRLC